MSTKKHTGPGPNPSGLCMCGCGERTQLAKCSSSRSGDINGTPRRFVAGHHRRTRFGDGPNPSGLCMCGCGGKTEMAKQTYLAAGIVYGKPVRYIRGHQSRPTDEDYSVDPVTGCWLWNRHIDSTGYGNKHFNNRTYKAHRWFYEQAKGSIPAGFHIHHTCRTRSCVNPDHLIALDQRAHGTLDPDIQYWRSRALSAERLACMIIAGAVA